MPDMLKGRIERNDNWNDNVFSQLRFKYFPYWPLFVILLLSCLVCAWFYLRYTIPVYESSAVILIKDQKNEFDDAQSTGPLNLLATKNIIQNEIEVLSARSLMGEVVKNCIYMHRSRKKELLRIRHILTRRYA